MNIIDAFKALTEGKKVRHRSWAGKFYIVASITGFVRCFEDGTERIYSNFYSLEVANLSIRNDDWEVYDDRPTIGELKPGEQFIDDKGIGHTKLNSNFYNAFRNVDYTPLNFDNSTKVTRV